MIYNTLSNSADEKTSLLISWILEWSIYPWDLSSHLEFPILIYHFSESAEKLNAYSHVDDSPDCLGSSLGEASGGQVADTMEAFCREWRLRFLTLEVGRRRSRRTLDELVEKYTWFQCLVPGHMFTHLEWLGRSSSLWLYYIDSLRPL